MGHGAPRTAHAARGVRPGSASRSGRRTVRVQSLRREHPTPRGVYKNLPVWADASPRLATLHRHSPNSVQKPNRLTVPARLPLAPPPLRSAVGRRQASDRCVSGTAIKKPGPQSRLGAAAPFYVHPGSERFVVVVPPRDRGIPIDITGTRFDRAVGYPSLRRVADPHPTAAIFHPLVGSLAPEPGHDGAACPAPAAGSWA
jgi:hypothetical protein